MCIRDRFKSNPIILLYLCYIIFLSSLILIGLLNGFSKLYFLSLIVIVYHMYFIQLNKFNSNEPEICLKIFQSNNLLGGIILISLLVGKLN